MRGAVTLEKVVGELQHIGPPFAQRRHANVHTAQAIEQIGPEQPAVDHLGQAPVGGRDDPDVDATGAVAADPLDGQILNRPQQLGLRRQRQVRHFVQKQRAAVGVLELSAAAP